MNLGHGRRISGVNGGKRKDERERRKEKRGRTKRLLLSSFLFSLSSK
jgi:hypothetical protein